MKGKISIHLPSSRLYCYVSSSKQASQLLDFVNIITLPEQQRSFNLYLNVSKLCRGVAIEGCRMSCFIYKKDSLVFIIVT